MPKPIIFDASKSQLQGLGEKEYSILNSTFKTASTYEQNNNHVMATEVYRSIHDTLSNVIGADKCQETRRVKDLIETRIEMADLLIQERYKHNQTLEIKDATAQQYYLALNDTKHQLTARNETVSYYGQVIQAAQQLHANDQQTIATLRKQLQEALLGNEAQAKQHQKDQEAIAGVKSDNQNITTAYQKLTAEHQQLVVNYSQLYNAHQQLTANHQRLTHDHETALATLHEAHIDGNDLRNALTQNIQFRRIVEQQQQEIMRLNNINKLFHQQNPHVVHPGKAPESSEETKEKPAPENKSFRQLVGRKLPVIPEQPSLTRSSSDNTHNRVKKMNYSTIRFC